MARVYKRDKQGRFAATGSGGSKQSLKGGGAPKSTVSASPRRLNKAEAAYWEMKHGKGKSKWKSDSKVLAEMQRRGLVKGNDPMGELINIASRARRKRGASY